MIIEKKKCFILNKLQIKSPLPPQEIFNKREELGIGTSIDLLVDIIENDNNKENRIEALKYLGIMKDPSCFEILENVLVSDDDVETKCEAAKALGRLKNKNALKPLKYVLEQENTDNKTKTTVLRAIASIRFAEKEIKLFIKNLECRDKSVKTCIKNRLINLGPEKLLMYLLESLKTDKMSEEHEITLIKLIGYELSGINLALDDSSFLKARYPEVFSELIQNKEFLLEILISIFNEDDSQLMKSTLIILDILGEEINTKLIDLLDDNDFIIKTNAIKLIGNLKVTNAVSALIRNLDNMYSEISMASIEALGEIGHISAIPELLSILDIKALNFEYIDYDMKWHILEAVRKIYINNETTSFDYLFEILETDNDFLKESIAFIMGEIANETFVDSLFGLINERNLDVRKNSIIALGKIGSMRAIDPLIVVLNAVDTYWLLKKVIVDAIFNIYHKNRHLIKSEDFNERRIFVITTERIIDYLKSHDNDNFKVKVSIIKFLEIHGEKTALPALIKQINDFHGIIKISATKAIKKIEKRLELVNEIIK